MASLWDRTKQYLTSGGQLAQEPTSLQQLAAEKGRGSPITPGGAALVGANADQQKMAGTPAQKQAALNMDTDQATTTAEALQQKQFRRGQTAQEQAAAGAAAKLAPLNTAADRVQNAVAVAAARMVGGTPAQAAPATPAPAPAPTPDPAIAAAWTKYDTDKKVYDSAMGQKNDLDVLYKHWSTAPKGPAKASMLKSLNQAMKEAGLTYDEKQAVLAGKGWTPAVQAPTTPTGPRPGQEAVQQQPAAQLAVPAELVATDPAKQAEAASLFTSLLTADPNSPDSISKFQQLQALTGKTAEQLASIATTSATAQGQTASNLSAMVGKGPGNLYVRDVDLGVPTAELAGLLGMQEADVAGLSLDELEAKIAGVQASTGVPATEQLSGSQTLGEAEREAARQQQAEQAASGVSTVSADLGKIGQALESAETVTYGGKQYTVKELLADGTVSKLVGDAAVDPAALDRLRSDPATRPLADFVDKYRADLAAAAGGIDKVGKASEAVLTKNKELATFGKEKLDTGLMSKLVPGWDQPGAKQLSPNNGLFLTLRNLPPDKQEATVQALNGLVLEDPSIADELAKLTSREAHALLTNPGYISNLVEANREKRAWAQLEDTGNIDQVIGFLFGGAPISPEAAQQWVSNESIRAGMGVASPALNYLDSNRDGKLDDIGSLKGSVEKYLSSADTVKEVAKGQQLPKRPQLQDNVPSPMTAKVWELTKDTLQRNMKDGKIGKAGITYAGMDIKDKLMRTMDASGFEQLKQVPLVASNPGLLKDLQEFWNRLHPDQKQDPAAEAVKAQEYQDEWEAGVFGPAPGREI